MLQMAWLRRGNTGYVTPIMVAIVSGTYFLTSRIFFKYPRLLHKVKDVKFTARHISHRGGAAEYYENTMTAFRKARENGTDMIEIDCQITKDGQVVVLHDYNLKRLTGVDVDISELPYNELPPLLDVLPIDFDPGKTYRHEQSDSADRRIPLLEELFQEFFDMPINIDVKVNNDDLINNINMLVTRYERTEISVWGSASSKISEKCYKLNPNINLFCSRRTVYLILISYYTGLLPFIPLNETHFEICLPSIYSSYRNDDMVDFLRSVGLKLLGFLLIRKSLFDHLRKRGIRVYMWVLNKNSDFEMAFKVGADGVMTDYPSRLTQYLASQNGAKNILPHVKQQ